jgi:hypothetical protein
MMIKEMPQMNLAIKCAPEKGIFDIAQRCGIGHIELYTSDSLLAETDNIIGLCNSYPFIYLIHAPTQGYQPSEVARLSHSLKAPVTVFHNIYLETEWQEIADIFSDIDTAVCIENLANAMDAAAYMRIHGFGRCLDFEHLIMETNGIVEEFLPSLIRETRHVHLTGYTFGSNKWHTPIHHAKEQSAFILDYLKKEQYAGVVTSEAAVSYQTEQEITRLVDFFNSWQKRSSY